MTTCWFCKTNAASPDCSEIVKMYGEVDRGDINNYLLVKTRSAKYKTCEINIPRCNKCKNKETNSTLKALFVLLCILGIAYVVISYGFGLSGWLSYVLIAGLAGTLCIASLILSSLVFSSETPAATGDFFNFYPPIMELVQKGWKMGDHPKRDF
jgi:hypothetical protein